MKLWERLFVFILQQELVWLADLFSIFSAMEYVEMFISNLLWVETSIKNVTYILFQMFSIPASAQMCLKI